MKPFVKYGLIVGVIALILIIPIAALMGICGPAVTLIAGAFAGFLTTYLGKTATTRREGAQSGALAGALAGAFTLLGQLIAAPIALAFIQSTGTHPFGAQVPHPGAPMYELVTYYGAGLGTGLCFGIVGLFLGAIAGALAGAFGTRQVAAVPVMPTNP